MRAVIRPRDEAVAAIKAFEQEAVLLDADRAFLKGTSNNTRFRRFLP
jgi:hypothetical protein